MAALDYLRGFLSGSSALWWLAVFVVGASMERLAPAERGQSIRDFRLNLAYALFTSWFGFAAAPILAIASGAVAAAFGGGLVALPADGWLLLPGAALYIFAIDFMEYLFHRAQHAWPFLWAMHSLHHSDRAVNVTTTTRQFWLEVPIKAVFVYPPVAILLQAPPAVVAIYTASTLYHFVNHLNLRASLGPLWRVINSPQYHRLHHSILPEHRDRNFAAYFPIFDIIFGTHCAPKPGEFPPTGLDTGDTPAGLAAAVFWPLRKAVAGFRKQA